MPDTWGGLRGEARTAATILAERLAIGLGEAIALVPQLPTHATTKDQPKPRPWGPSEAARRLPLAQLHQLLAAHRN